MNLKFLYCTLMVISVEFAFGQIQLMNPSFEGGGDSGLCVSGVCPIGWTMCEFGVTNCDIHLYATGLIPDTSYDGESLAGILVEGNTFNGSFSQTASCIFNPNYTYYFQAAFALTWAKTVPTFYKPGPISIFLGNDTCDFAEMIYLSPILDTIWKMYDVVFTPQNSYNTFIFRGVPNNNGIKYNVVIDALSPIYVLNANQVHSSIKDTVFTKGSTACVPLSATTDTAMGSVWWEQVGVGAISNQLNAGVFCTDTNTTYIIHTLSRDSTCAGYLPSSDTVRVRFYDPNAVSDVNGSKWLTVYPNPMGNRLTLQTEVKGNWQLWNSMGQKIMEQYIEQGNTTIPTAGLPNGVYYYSFTFGNQMVKYCKLIKQ